MKRSILFDKYAQATLQILLFFIVISGVAAPFYFLPASNSTVENKTTGDITFFDVNGNQLEGLIRIEGAGISGGEKSNASSISWEKVPKAEIYFDVLNTRHLSIKLKISEDSPKGKVTLENYGNDTPSGINIPAPGVPIKYVEARATGVHFSQAEISIQYNDTELKGNDEKILVIYSYDSGNLTWNELPTINDAENNILKSQVDSLSIFAVSTKAANKQDTSKISAEIADSDVIEVHNTKKMPVIGEIKTYDGSSNLKKAVKGNTLSQSDLPDGGELEVDALADMNVAVKLKVNRASGGEIILDDYGKNNPVAAPLPGKPLKYVEIHANNILYSSAEVKIKYSEDELDGIDESKLVIYHWNGAAWEPLETQVDTVNNIMSAKTTSLSPFGATMPNDPLRLFAFTDKQVYLDYAYQWDNTISSGSDALATPTDVFRQKVNLFVLLLDSDGNIVRGLSASNFSAALRDTERWNHSGPGLASYPFYTVEPTNGVYYNNQSFPIFSDADGDGIFNSTKTNNQTLTFRSPNVTLPLNAQLNVSINVTVNYNGTIYKTNVSVIFGNMACRSGHDQDAEDGHTKSQHDGVVCSACHWGYQYALGVHGPNNTVMKNDPARWKGIPLGMDQPETRRWDYRTGLEGTIEGNTTWDNSNASYCLLCHGGTTLINNEAYKIGQVLTFFANTPTVTDQNSDTLIDNKRPSCSWYQGPENGTGSGSYPVCHGPQSGLNGSTNITGSQLFKVDWTDWTQQEPGQSKSHNHTSTPKTNGSPCALCHAGGGAPGTGTGGLHMVAGLPNRTTTDYTNINTQCWSCHNITGGYLNITSNGGTAVAHSSTDCKSCHKDSNSKLDAHLVPVGVSGGGNCSSCHDVGDTPPATGALVNFTAMNNSLAIHKNLNSGDTSNVSIPAVNRKCWACHGNGSDPGSSHNQTRYNNPFKCVDCHVNRTNLRYTPNSTLLNVTEHYWNGTDIDPSITACYNCHNKSEMMLGTVLDPDGAGSVYSGANGGNNSSSHYGKKRTDMASWNTSVNNTYCIYCHNNASTVFPFNYSTNKSIANHSANYPATNPLCSNSTCHNTGRLHNSTLYKPRLSLPNSTYCISSCHGTGNATLTNNKGRHNNSLNCTQCHLNSSRSIHPARYLNSDGITWSTSNTTAINCTNCHLALLSNFSTADQIPNILKHSSNISNGSIWNSTGSPYWTNGSSSCYYCHNNTIHNATGLGRISALMSDTNNTGNGSLTTTTWCADCHYNDSANPNYRGNSSEWSPIPPLITINNTGKSYWINHSSYLANGYKDSNCKLCHSLNNTSYLATSLNYSHSLDEGVTGGKNCTSCHYIGSPFKQIDVNIINSSVHKGMNRANASNGGVDVINGACWACHESDGNVSSGHPDRYKTPKTCTECHLGTATYNASAYNALIVKEHFFSGDQIKAGNSTSDIESCINCHENVSEMILNNSDNDYGTFTGDGIRLQGGNMSFYHYGKSRTDLRRVSPIAADCYYCHNNSTTAFSIGMQDPTVNKSIYNHTDNVGAGPKCTNSFCHAGGWIHNISLDKPSFTNGVCLGCHTTLTDTHKGTMNCWNCHLDPNGILFKTVAHGMSYPQTDGSFLRWEKGTPANCTTCHVYNLVNNADNYPTIIPSLKHSSDPYSGKKWGNYWDNSSTNTSCHFCHQSEIHISSPIGNISTIQGSNTFNNADLSNSYWCAACHYNNSNPNYQGTILNPVPPEILNRSGSVPATAADGTSFKNHSDYLSSGYNDSVCRTCHAMNGTYNITSRNYSHSLDEGISGGPNCIGCHNSGGSASGGGKLVNFSAMNESTSLHSDLNRNASSSNVTATYANNKKCWACHGNGSEPAAGDHPSIYRTPYNCTSCHIQGAGQNLNFTPVNILNVTQHYWNGTSIGTAAVSTCYDCHNKTEMMVGQYDPDGAGTNVYGGINGGNNSSSHYGKKRPDYQALQGTDAYCTGCHNNSSTVFPFVDASNKTISNHSANKPQLTPFCGDCHETQASRLHNSTLYKPSFSLPNSSYCATCHVSRARHNNTVNCTSCHLNTSRSIHPVRYLQNINNTWSTSNTSAVNCTNCHQTILSNFSGAPQIPAVLKHSNDPSAGMKWGNYWNNSSTTTACYYCHQSEVHRATGLLGNITSIKGSNTFNNPDLTNATWCQNCHYSGASQYNGTVFYPVPPEITNSSLNSTDGTPFYNHSGFANYNDSVCKGCHGGALSGYSETTRNFTHSVSEGGGGADCISCHDIGGSGAPLNKRITASSMRLGVHKNLNSNAANSSAIDSLNKACWACHGEGIEPSGHPLRYKTPRECSNDDCHSIFQSFKAPMVYSHFKDAELNSNPGRVINYNVSTTYSCESCHSNSLSAESNNLNASVSHYATLDKLIDSRNCIYCHLDEDNALKWGNATEINKNRTAIVEMNRERNKFTVHAGESVDLGLGYRLKLIEVSTLRGSAAIELYRSDILVDSGLVNIGEYKYEETRVIKNATSKIPIILLNITSMFGSGYESLIQFEGFRVRRLHSETKTTSCYLCHYNGGAEKRKYSVIERVDDKIYYTEILFNSSDTREYDQQQALQKLALLTPEDTFVDLGIARRKTLQQAEKWEITEGFSLTLTDVASYSESAFLTLNVGDRTYTDIVKRGDILEYEYGINYLGYTDTNFTVFRARVSEIFRGQKNIVVLEDIVARSQDIVKIDINSTIYGYNATWLWKNNTFMTGRIPSSLHAPLLNDGKAGGPDCVACHGTKELGYHKILNKEAASTVADENKACWACHGDGKEPKGHPVQYKTPRKCKSCHVESGLTYNATSIKDEKHSTLENCNTCHVVDTHKIIRFNVVPGIKVISISKDEINAGEKIRINATAVAGFNMRVKGAEYYIDSQDNTFAMSALDGSFDGQVEDITAEVDTSGLKPGNHMIHVRAMELNGKWGVESSVSFIVKEKMPAIGGEKPVRIPDVPGFAVMILIIVSIYIRKIKKLDG